MSAKIKVLSAAGARPNFMKLAAVSKALGKYPDIFIHKICHTGQHFDPEMSKIFFQELELSRPDFYLGVGSGSHAEQTAKIMIEFEKVLLREKPDLVMVYGDVNSTLACSIVAAKCHTKIAHVEAGLRSFDRSMPEEINRVLTDHLSHFLFVTESSGIKNLRKEGILKKDKKNVSLVGNVMIDNLVGYLPKIGQSKVMNTLGLSPQDFILVTIHRPDNVDHKKSLNDVVGFLEKISRRKKVAFPIHPRTRKNLIKFDLQKKLNPNLLLIDPLGYIDFLKLMEESALVITDSGGIQEESTFLGIQCVTVRNNTERPITTDIGTNHLAGTDLGEVEKTVNNILDGHIKKGKIPDLWDGKAAERIVEILKKELYNRREVRG